jgi:hypothetical protein
LAAPVSNQCSDFVHAEKLLRTVMGIADVRIVSHPSGGVAMVRVHCNDEASPGQIVRNIRSALFAGCGIAVSSECIDFVSADQLTGDVARGSLIIESQDAGTVAAITNSAPPKTAVTPAFASKPSTPKILPQAPAASVRGIQVVTPRGDSTAPAASFEYVSDAVATQTQRVQRIMHVVTADETEAQHAKAAVASAIVEQRAAHAVGATVRDIVASAAGLRLESVEMRRQSGRLRCRVVISLGTDHFGAVADSADPNAQEIHLAGRVACDALRAGGFTDARFDGAAVAQINGRQHVVVALSEWMGGETMVLSGAAPLEDVPERAAAIAAIKAVLAQDIN